jgi:CelD/BcsL family acetyltransferase involved in cellulose biosynthesis
VGDRGQAETIDGAQLTDPGLIEAWRRLAEQRENPFSTPDWFHAWIAAYPAEEPFVIAWRVDGELRGILPLVRVRGRLGGHLLRFAGARRGDWFTPVCVTADEPAMAAACADLLRRERRRWSRLRLDRIDAGDAWARLLWAPGNARAVAPGGWRRTDVLPFIGLGDGFDAYLEARSRNLRSQLGRRRRKLERDHGLAFRMTSSAAEFEADFDTFVRLHLERWSHRGGSSSGAEDVLGLHRAFAATALERGWLRLWTAEADGVPAASWYGLRIGDRYCYSLSGLSDRYEPFGLGLVLLAHTIERAAAEGASVYDLMWGDEPYKQRFETGRREVATWVLARRDRPARFAVAARSLVERTVRGARGG